MSRPHPTLATLISHLRPTATDFAAAAALHDPSFLLQLRAADPHDDRR
jgi:hypothetical protein